MKQRIVLVVLLGLLCNPLLSFGQDSTAVKDVNEEKELKFQQYFFKALSEKSIKNYQKAIENLEFCNELFPEDVSVQFEFSKNYLLLNQVEEAKQYITRALEKEPNNVWMLTHLVDVYKKERNYFAAIDIQKKIVAQDAKQTEALIRLHYLNRDYDQAIAMMNELEKENGLSRGLKSLRTSLQFRKRPSVKKKTEDLKSLMASFRENSSFTILKKLLDRLGDEDPSNFHKLTEEAIDLYPAQPYVYLMRGRSLQIQGKFQQAISILETGIDFVIDNANLEGQFYEIMAKVHDGLGNTTEAQEYRDKAKKLKAVK